MRNVDERSSARTRFIPPLATLKLPLHKEDHFAEVTGMVEYLLCVPVGVVMPVYKDHCEGQ